MPLYQFAHAEDLTWLRLAAILRLFFEKAVSNLGDLSRVRLEDGVGRPVVRCRLAPPIVWMPFHAEGGDVASK
jgi:hypothetical protein